MATSQKVGGGGLLEPRGLIEVKPIFGPCKKVNRIKINRRERQQNDTVKQVECSIFGPDCTFENQILRQYLRPVAMHLTSRS